MTNLEAGIPSWDVDSQTSRSATFDYGPHGDGRPLASAPAAPAATTTQPTRASGPFGSQRAALSSQSAALSSQSAAMSSQSAVGLMQRRPVAAAGAHPGMGKPRRRLYPSALGRRYLSTSPASQAAIPVHSPRDGRVFAEVRCSGSVPRPLLRVLLHRATPLLHRATPLAYRRPIARLP